MSDFSLHHRQPSSASPKDFSPRTGDLVSAKHPEDSQWYRAKVRKSSALKKEAVLVFIDYGNEETPLQPSPPSDAPIPLAPWSSARGAAVVCQGCPSDVGVWA